MKCDIIIPIWNQLEATRDCVDSIFRNTRHPYRLILVDNASDNETRLYLENVAADKKRDVKLIRNEKNLGFVKAVNQGLKVSYAPYVCVFNNDTITTPGWLEQMIDFAEANKEIGIVNPLCDGPHDIPIDEYASKVAKDKRKYIEMNQCFLFCALIKREVIDKIGYLDEAFGIGCFDDTDYSMRAGLAGYRCAYLQSAYVKHIHGISFKALGNREHIVKECERIFFKKWPRHLRVGITFHMSDDTGDAQIVNLIKVSLFLAREWCRVNLWIFGNGDKNKERLGRLSKKVRAPVHQNIKLNFLQNRCANFQILTRLIERAFGTKRRKRYDFVLSDDKDMAKLLQKFYFLHRMNIEKVDFEEDVSRHMKEILNGIRDKK